MKFRFDIRLTDKDYLDFNIFWMIKSHYGKKEMLKLRVGFVVLFGIGAALVLLMGEKSANTYINAAFLCLLCVAFEVFMNRFFAFTLKNNIKSMKKKGKMGYSPEAVMEFFEDYFTETTPENKTEQKYTAVERISIIRDEFVYIHINNVMAYLLPVNAFSSRQEYDSFIEFMKTKTDNIDIY